MMEINTRSDCPILHVADIIWDKWTLLIIRNLLLDGPHRFQDFMNALEGIGPTTLSKRLKSLESHGLIKRSVIDDRPPRTKYELTKLGMRAKPMMKAVRNFGDKITNKKPDAPQ